MLQDNFLDQPWECEGLDPFRDGPIATESGFEYDDIDEAKSDEENGRWWGGSVHLLQLCAHAKFGGKIVLHWLLGWQREYKSTGFR